MKRKILLTLGILAIGFISWKPLLQASVYTFKILSPGINLKGPTSDPTVAKAGDIYFNPSLLKFRQYDGTSWSDVGSGSGGGGINYILNPDAETNTNGWATYADSAGNIPVDGTGGTATGLTFSRTTSSPLIGNGSFLLVQANSTSLQGKGVSYDFDIDDAFQGAKFNVVFYANASSTFVASDNFTPPLNDGTTSTNAGNSDIEVFVYDITNAVLIPVTPQVISSNGALNFGFFGQFQAASNSTSYRLILHVATTSANATGWQLKFDNVAVGPMNTAQGPPAVAVSYFASANGTWSTTQDLNFDTKVYDTCNCVTASAPGTGTWKFTAPVSDVYRLGGNIVDNAGNVNAFVYKNGSNFAQLTYLNTTSGSNPISYEIKLLAGDYIEIRTNTGATYVGGSVTGNNTASQITISGLNKVSADADSKVLVASYRLSGNVTSDTSTPVAWDVKIEDTHGVMSGGVFTAPESAFYEIAAMIGAASQHYSQLYKNGSLLNYNFIIQDSSDTGYGSQIVRLVAGDTLDIRSDNSQTITGGVLTTAGNSWVQVKKLIGSAPLTVAPALQVAIIEDQKTATTPGGNSVANTWTQRDLNTITKSQPWVTNSSNQFTLAPGEYLIEAWAPGWSCAAHMVRLVDTTNTLYYYGSTEYSYATGTQASTSVSHVQEDLVLATTTVFQLETNAQLSTTGGFGIASNFTPTPAHETYSRVKITKIK